MEDIIFNSYLVGEERELAIEESTMDVLFADLNMKYEMVNMQLEYDKKAAEYKVFSEGGTYDDFLYLLEEANDYAKKTKNDNERNLFEKLRNQQLNPDQCNKIADHIWSKINDDRHAKTPHWGLDDATWKSIPQDVQNVISGRVNNAGKQQNNNTQANATANNNTNNNNNDANNNAQNINASAVDELLINPFVDYISESDKYNMEISEIADMIASL